MKCLDGNSSVETVTSSCFTSTVSKCAYPPFRFIWSKYDCIDLYPSSSLNSIFEVVIANACSIVESFTLHPNSVTSILRSWIHDVTPFLICFSIYLARKYLSEAGDLYLEITWSFMEQVWHHTPDERCSPVFELLNLR